MRLSYILEDVGHPKYDLLLRQLADKEINASFARPDWDQLSQAEKQVIYDAHRKDMLFLRKMMRHHKDVMGGKRWPALENVLIKHKLEYDLLRYLNALTEPWPEGQQLFAKEFGRGWRGATEMTLDYLLKHNIESPEVLAAYDEYQSAAAMRRELKSRLKQLQDELEKELAKPPPTKVVTTDPSGLDDEDAFHAWENRLTVKQIRNRIAMVEKALAASDEELRGMTSKRNTRSVNDALRIWSQPNAHAYAKKYGRF